MAIKGNKGEWSEFYAFLKILVDGKMFAADKNLNILEEKFFTVLKIIREEKGGKNFYNISKKGNILITNEEGKKIGLVKLKKIKNIVTKIFLEMKNSSSTTFEISLAEKTMRNLHCTQIKASSGRKADLIIVVHDRIAQIEPELGFSIKSMLGSPSTLLNASMATNFVFEILGPKEKNNEDVNNIKGSSKIMDRAKYIYNSGGQLKFDKMDSDEFKKNLRKIDSNLPYIVSEMLKHYFNSKESKITDLVNFLAKDKNFYEKFDLTKNDLEYKIKNFLSAVALGMTPKKMWDGFTKAHGGYIIVKENGEVVCYHLYNRDEFEEYLYQNTKFDTPSSTRHNFGKVYEKNGKQKIKYNLQIRFIK